jgi:hypothetical protein
MGGRFNLGLGRANRSFKAGFFEKFPQVDLLESVIESVGNLKDGRQKRLIGGSQ